MRRYQEKNRETQRKITAWTKTFHARPPPHQRPWLTIRWESEQLLGYWASCETVKGSAAPLIPRGREGQASMGSMPFSFTLPTSSSSYPPALVMMLLLSAEEQLDGLHRCMSTNTVLNTLHAFLGVYRFQRWWVSCCWRVKAARFGESTPSCEAWHKHGCINSFLKTCNTNENVMFYATIFKSLGGVNVSVMRRFYHKMTD